MLPTFALYWANGKIYANPIKGRWWKDLLKWLKIITSSRTPASTRYWTKAGLMLGQQCRRWASISPALSRVCRDGLAQAVTHSGEGLQQRRDIEHVLVKCWPIVNDAGPTLKQHKGNVTCLLGGGGCSWRQSQCYNTARWGGDRHHCVYTPTPNPPPPTTTCYSSHLLWKGSICSLVKYADTVGQL